MCSGRPDASNGMAHLANSIQRHLVDCSLIGRQKAPSRPVS